MDPQNILNSKGFIIEMIKTGTNANFLLKNTLKTDAVFTIYMAAETEFLYIQWHQSNQVNQCICTTTFSAPPRKLGQK